MIEEGAMLPDHELIRPEGTPFRPSDYRGQKLVIFFYPKASTPGCTTEARDFSTLLPEFAKAGAAVLGVSADSPKKQAGFVAKQGLTVDIGSDESTEFLGQLGVWAEKQMYGKSYMGIIRSTLLVGADGKVLKVWPKVSVKGHAQAVLEAVKTH
ncbi:MAG: peroxiredoxin [Parasphingorhabdus sp.]|nr:peroxiredoxin [Parasphingorhabdus sp.]